MLTFAGVKAVIPRVVKIRVAGISTLHVPITSRRTATAFASLGGAALGTCESGWRGCGRGRLVR